MKCPAADPGFWHHPIHGALAQRELIRRVIRLCRQGYPSAVDVGAHIGVWSVALAEQTFEVHAFEPEPENYDCLRQNVGDLPVRTYPYGLSDRAFQGDLKKASQDNSGMWRIDFDARPNGPLGFQTLDAQGIQAVGLIKIDVEGHEGAVLYGAAETIKRDKPVIVFEDNGVGPRYFGPGWVDPKNVLRSLGYIRQARVRKDEIWLPA